MLEHVILDKILFLDIETVSAKANFEDLSDEQKKLWERKAKQLPTVKDGGTIDEAYSLSAIYAEFGKIVCISVGILIHEDDQYSMRLKSFAGDDEQKLLGDFADMLNNHYSSDKHLLCAHNGKEFDFPYICRRMLINNIKLPYILNIAGKKPWEIQHLDTMELWKFGDYKHYTPLNLLAHIFGIPTPKDDIDGSEVGKVYWQDKDLSRIVVYCQKDVATIIQLVLRYKGFNIVPESRIFIS